MQPAPAPRFDRTPGVRGGGRRSAAKAAARPWPTGASTAMQIEHSAALGVGMARGRRAASQNAHEAAGRPQPSVSARPTRRRARRRRRRRAASAGAPAANAAPPGAAAAARRRRRARAACSSVAGAQRPQRASTLASRFSRCAITLRIASCGCAIRKPCPGASQSRSARRAARAARRGRRAMSPSGGLITTVEPCITWSPVKSSLLFLEQVAEMVRAWPGVWIARSVVPGQLMRSPPCSARRARSWRPATRVPRRQAVTGRRCAS